jgi:hypothetical protein
VQAIRPVRRQSADESGTQVLIEQEFHATPRVAYRRSRSAA